jgi:hypothetical protein
VSVVAKSAAIVVKRLVSMTERSHADRRRARSKDDLAVRRDLAARCERAL